MRGWDEGSPWRWSTPPGFLVRSRTFGVHWSVESKNNGWLADRVGADPVMAVDRRGRVPPYWSDGKEVAVRKKRRWCSGEERINQRSWALSLVVWAQVLMMPRSTMKELTKAKSMKLNFGLWFKAEMATKMMNLRIHQPQLRTGKRD